MAPGVNAYPMEPAGQPRRPALKLREADTLFFVRRNVSRSGIKEVDAVFYVDDDKSIVNASAEVAAAIGLPYDQLRDGIVMRTQDRTLADVTARLSRKLFGRPDALQFVML